MLGGPTSASSLPQATNVVVERVRESGGAVMALGGERVSGNDVRQQNGKTGVSDPSSFRLHVQAYTHPFVLPAHFAHGF